MADVARLGRYALQYAHETRTGHVGIEVRCPTVVVHGRRDRIIPVHSSRVLHQRIPNSELVVLTRSGHCPQLDDPDEVVRLISARGTRRRLEGLTTCPSARFANSTKPPASVSWSRTRWRAIPIASRFGPSAISNR